MCEKMSGKSVKSFLEEMPDEVHEKATMRMLEQTIEKSTMELTLKSTEEFGEKTTKVWTMETNGKTTMESTKNMTVHKTEEFGKEMIMGKVEKFIKEMPMNQIEKFEGETPDEDIEKFLKELDAKKSKQYAERMLLNTTFDLEHYDFAEDGDFEVSAKVSGSRKVSRKWLHAQDAQSSSHHSYLPMINELVYDDGDVVEAEKIRHKKSTEKSKSQSRPICPILVHLQLEPIMNKTDFKQFDDCVSRFIIFQKSLSDKELTEWLLKKKLVCCSFRCINHPNQLVEIAKYNTKYDGHVSTQYCWWASCCRQRIIKLSCNSIFQISKLSPVNVLLVITEWSRCSTLFQAIRNCPSMPDKEIVRLYKKLRAICTLQLMEQERSHKLGGSERKVEAHMLPLNERADVFLLVVIDRQSCEVRMQLRSATTAVSKRDQRLIKRKQELQMTLHRWVHKSSELCIDDSINTDLVLFMGFESLHQGSPVGQWGNRHAVFYARKVAKRLQALCALPKVSQSKTQLLLNELLWREQYAANNIVAFNNILDHLGEQTQQLGQVGLEMRLTNAALHPFKPLSGNKM